MHTFESLAAHPEMAGSGASLFGVLMFLLMIAVPVTSMFRWVTCSRTLIGGVVVFGIAQGLATDALIESLLVLGLWSAIPLVLAPPFHLIARGDARALGEPPPRFDPWRIYRNMFTTQAH